MGHLLSKFQVFTRLLLLPEPPFLDLFCLANSYFPLGLSLKEPILRHLVAAPQPHLTLSRPALCSSIAPWIFLRTIMDSWDYSCFSLYWTGLSRRGRYHGCLCFVCIFVFSNVSPYLSQCVVHSRHSMCSCWMLKARSSSEWLSFRSFNSLSRTSIHTGYKEDLEKEVCNLVGGFTMQNPL